MSTIAAPVFPSPRFERKAQPATSLSLVAAAKVGIADRVLVIGRNVIEQVIALSRTGCRSLLSLRAESAYPRDEPVDVLWFGGIDDVRSRLGAALTGVNVPRIVVIEVNGEETESRLRPIIQQLRGHGFARFTLHRTVHGVAVMAARPAWLQQVL